MRIMIFITIVLGVITILGAFAGRISPDKSSLMTYIGLLLPFLLMLCALSALYWLARFRGWVWIPLIAICTNWVYLSSMIQIPFRKGDIAPKAGTLKIATYNVGHFSRDKSGLTARRTAYLMAKEQADIICFQEFNEFQELPYDSLNAIFNAWTYSVIPKAENGQNLLPLAVYSKYPIVDSGLIAFSYSANNSMWVDVRINNKVIRIFNNHLQTTNINQSKGSLKTGIFLYSMNDIVRARQAEIISELIKKSPHPVVVAGDFNATPSSYTYRTMKGDLKDGFRTAGYGWGYTFRYFKRLLRIDYILHSHSLEGSNYYSPDIDYGSDHNPVFMQMEVE